MPIPPTPAKAMPSDLHLWFWEHVKDRLERTCNDDNVPAVNWNINRGINLNRPLSGESSILKESLLYFAPDRLKKAADKVWPEPVRTAKARVKGPGIFTRTAKTSDYGVPRPAAALDSRGFMRSEEENNTTTLASTEEGGNRPEDEKPRNYTDRQAPEKSLLHNIASAFNSMLGAAAAQAREGGPADYDKILFYHTDHLGSTRVVTDQANDLYERIDFFTGRVAGAVDVG